MSESDSMSERELNKNVTINRKFTFDESLLPQAKIKPKKPRLYVNRTPSNVSEREEFSLTLYK